MEKVEKVLAMARIAYTAARRRARYAILIENHSEDLWQTCCLAAVFAVVNNLPVGREFYRLVDREVWKLGRDLGYFSQVGRPGIPKHPKKCCVEGCDRPAPYKDGQLGGWVCRRHYSLIRIRRVRGWEDPYKGLKVGPPAEEE